MSRRVGGVWQIGPVDPGRELRPRQWCRRPGSNRHGPFGPRDFKSLVSTNSTTPAHGRIITSIHETRASRDWGTRFFVVQGCGATGCRELGLVPCFLGSEFISGSHLAVRLAVGKTLRNVATRKSTNLNGSQGKPGTTRALYRGRRMSPGFDGLAYRSTLNWVHCGYFPYVTSLSLFSVGRCQVATALH